MVQSRGIVCFWGEVEEVGMIVHNLSSIAFQRHVESGGGKRGRGIAHPAGSLERLGY